MSIKVVTYINHPRFPVEHLFVDIKNIPLIFLQLILFFQNTVIAVSTEVIQSYGHYNFLCHQQKEKVFMESSRQFFMCLFVSQNQTLPLVILYRILIKE